VLEVIESKSVSLARSVLDSCEVAFVAPISAVELASLCPATGAIPLSASWPGAGPAGSASALELDGGGGG